MVRAAVGDVLQGVRRFHRERPFRRSHHEALAGDQLRDLVGVDQLTTEETGHECDPGADRKRLRGLSFSRLDVLVPARRVVRNERLGGNLVARSIDVGLWLRI